VKYIANMQEVSSMAHPKRLPILTLGLLMAFAGQFTHAAGSSEPQPVDTTELKQLGEEWVEVNPYRDDARAIAIGASAYNQNCARCHGLGGVSGGIAPDLRMLPAGDEGDEWFAYRVREGAIRNGITYMPKMAEYLNQEALWAIRAWLETVHVEQ
jgi:cytochrome c-550 PedF